MKMSEVALIAIALAAPVSAQTSPAPSTPPAPRLVPDVAPNGDVTAKIDLGAEFPQMKGYVFSQTVTTVAPGTGRPLHSHANFPEIVRIVSGTLTDARNGGAPTAYGPGSTLVNAAGTKHMWANLGKEPVVFIATSIRAAQ